MSLESPKFAANEQLLITKISTFEALLKQGHALDNCTVRGLDLRPLKIVWRNYELANTIFLGCELTLEEEFELRRLGAEVINAPKGLPYNPFRTELYTWQELEEQRGAQTVDLTIYDHFSKSRFNPSINEALWQRIHDHAIDDDLRQLLAYNDDGMTERKCVAIMGGHSTRRDDPYYRKTAEATQLLTEAGYYVASGGGPGTMEAANLGAYLAGQGKAALDEAITELIKAPHYTSDGFQEAAFRVLDRFPEGQESLAIPTWFYGHEPSNIFATHIAKYFSNSIREDTLLAVALYGIVFSPGSAGTTQEIFMDAAQNHYATFNFYSPMIFLGRKRYEIDTMIYPLLRQLSHGKPYHDLLLLTDEPEEILGFLREKGPVGK